MTPVTDQLEVDDGAAAPTPSPVEADVAVDESGDPDQPGEPALDADQPSGAFAAWRERRRNRVSRWDRPPPPKDWRYWVGGLGRVLIATGLLLFAFVAYQLWGTGIETARAQNRLDDEFEQLLAEFADEPSSEVTVSTVAERTPTERDRPAPVESAADPDDGYGVIVATASDSTPIAFDLSDEAVVQDPIPRPERGDPLFRLEIPAIGRDDIVVAGVSLDNLKDGPGHYPDTPLPGQLGNASVAGHRTTYGAPFFDVDRLEVGDELITTLANGDRFVYEVTFIEVVRSSDYSVVTTSDPSIAELTLTSCHPKYTARDRIVVHSVLNPAKSSNVGIPTFYALEPDVAGEIPGDDPVLSASDVDPDEIEITGTESVLADPSSGDGEAVTSDGSADDASAAGGESDETGDSSGDVDEPVAAGDDTTSSAGQASPAPAATQSGGDATDAFSRGWFDDDDAWPQIALWGSLLILISVLAYQAAKRTRHTSVGVLVGVAPFVVALYFFFQNVHRLLPPGI